MDVNTEKEMVAAIKSIADSLKEIKSELSEITIAVRESNSLEEGEE